MEQNVCILVHGTFSPNAAWTRDGSSIRRAIERRLKVVRFVTPQWSGRNSFVHREQAAEIIGSAILSESSKSPGARLFVVAHSHGGTAALLAYNDESVRNSVAGTVFMSTPFLHARMREIGRRNAEAFAFLATVGMLLIGLFLAWFLEWHFWITGALVTAVASGVSLFGAALVAVWWASRVVELTRQPPLDFSRMLVVRVAGDEASGALAAANFFSWLLNKLLSVLNVPVRYMLRVLPKLRGAMAFSVIAAIVTPTVLVILINAFGSKFISGDPADIADLDFAARVVMVLFGALILPFALAATVLCIYAVVAILLIPVALLHSVLLFAFGRDAALASMALEVTVESTPLGQHTVYTLPAVICSAQSDADEPYMSHSVYDDDEACEIIAKWMSDA